MTNCISLVYVEIETELLKPIWPIAVCGENHIRKYFIDHTGVVYTENDTELLWLIG